VNKLDHLVNTRWDCVVVGTGMGGATLGHSLALAGRKVLFVERGRAHFRHADTLRGTYPEMAWSGTSTNPGCSSSDLLCAGRFPDSLLDDKHRFIPMIGTGSGGSSALYGMAMERFLPSDFSPPHQADSHRQSWPIGYAELEPWYAKAESLYRVRGGRDPVRPPAAPLPPAPPPSRQAAELQQHFAHQGLHPYALPLACERVPGCTCCQGYLCPRDCKNDASRICLEPALEQASTALIDECEVLRLNADTRRVTGVVCRTGQHQFELDAQQVVLAAGALHTPSILLRSASERWPEGLSNRSGLVGRNLMRHFVDLYLVFTRVGGSHPMKEIGLTDFYDTEFGRMGTIQSFGQLPPASMLADTLRDDVAQVAPWATGIVRTMKPLLTAAMEQLFQRGMLLAAIMEDSPSPDNRVVPGSPLQVRYQPADGDLQRLRLFREKVGQALRPYRFLRLQQAEKNAMLAHVCGTCRFGDDPTNSVLNRHNRSHELDNLYVVDASWFPSSGGTNPALTVAANALRVADHILGSSSRQEAG